MTQLVHRPWRIFEKRLDWMPRFLPFGRPITIWWPWREQPRVYRPHTATYLDPDSWAITLAHEMVHVRQWRRLGRVRFLAKYLLSRRGRLELEAEAFAVNVCFWAAKDKYSFHSMLSHYTAVLMQSYGLWGVPRCEVREALRAECE